MINQQGLGSLILLGALTLLFLGFYAGATSQKTIVSNITEVLKTPESNASSSATIQSVEPQKNTLTRAKDGWSSTTEANTITLSGRFTIPDYNKIFYTFSFPKNGGEITGTLSGFCNGKITGQVRPQDTDKEATFTGLLDATCSPYVGFSNKTDMKAALSGLVEYQTGKVHIIYEFSKPYYLRGSTDVSFTP